jgi:hypothetical protein
MCRRFFVNRKRFLAAWSLLIPDPAILLKWRGIYGPAIICTGFSTGHFYILLIKFLRGFGIVMRGAATPNLPKGFHYEEAFDVWREVSWVGGKLDRFKILQNSSSRGCLRSHADNLSGHVWPGYRKFFR